MSLARSLAMKSNRISENYRQEGNKLYRIKSYRESLGYYNDALCYIKDLNSTEAALIYANRSIIYLELQYPEQCLENIEMARNAGYPADKIKVLDKRQRKCEKMMRNPLKEFFKLSYPAHEKTPFVANCIEMREDEKFGRGLYANRDLKTGDVIVDAEPVVIDINKLNYFIQCTNCGQTNFMSLIPCPSCVYAMFCSKKCQQEANEKFHNIECSHMSAVFAEASEDRLLPLIWRPFMRMQNAVGGVKKLHEICNDETLASKTFFDYDLSKEGNEALEANKYLALLGRRSILRRFTTCYVPENHAIQTILRTQPMRSMWETRAEKEMIKEILMKTTEILLNPILTILLSRPQSEIPRGAYRDQAIKNMIEEKDNYSALSSMFFNHNCVPDIYGFNSCGTYFWIVQHPVKKDQQIFTSYRFEDLKLNLCVSINIYNNHF